MTAEQGLRYSFDDAWLIDGVRTPFVDYTGAFAEVSPIDLGIKAARAVIEKAGVPASDVGTTIAGSMAQAYSPKNRTMAPMIPSQTCSNTAAYPRIGSPSAVISG